MDLRQCRLSKDGEHARDDLLEILYPNNSYNASQLERDTGLDRATTIPKILPPAEGNLQQIKLEQFFRRLLQLLKSLNEEIFIEYLQNHRLTDSCKQLLESEESFYLPHSFYVPGNISGKTSDAQKGRQKSPKSKSKKSDQSAVGDVTDLFWHLDYRNQERKFGDALDAQNQCVAFAIAAPCPTTQRWILNRLRRQIPNLDNALILPAISLKQHPMRNQFGHFWEDLSQRLGTKPSPDEVLKGMCHANVDCPIILTIYEFRQFEKTQAYLFQKFWKPLTDAITSSKRSQRSRIVLFLVDQSCPSHDTEIVTLDPLEAILQQDVTKWLSSDPVTQFWRLKLGDEFEKGLVERLAIEHYQEPYYVLDKLCFELGIKGGIVDIEEAWKWAS